MPVTSARVSRVSTGRSNFRRGRCVCLLLSRTQQMTITAHVGLAAAALFAALTVGGALASNDPLASYRWRARVLVVVSPEPNDARLVQQKAIYRSIRQGAEERDMALVEAVGNNAEARALRRSLSLGDGFRAVLVGKDGGVKLSSAEPLGADQLFPLIDAMPMRQDEMRRRP
jgi:hypothetical protein